VALQYAAAVLRQEEIRATLGQLEATPLLPDGELDHLETRRLQEFLYYSNGQTPVGLLESRRRLVRRLEIDPDSVVEEYEDGLTRRDRLHEAVGLITPTSRQRLDATLAAIDGRFTDATDSVSAPVRPAIPWRPQAWWWYRVPRAGDERVSAT